MKKFLSLLLSLLFSVAGATAFAEENTAHPVLLDYTTIIDGETLYYSGSIDGGEVGVYVMNQDGSDPQKISSATADLLALSSGRLLIYNYDLDSGDASMAILSPDGTLYTLEDMYSGSAIAADGRFYWGMGSCADDGSDVQIYFTGDAVSASDYYPLSVQDGYYYYLDWSEMSGQVFYEGSWYPIGAALCRMNLSDQTHEVVSGIGTAYLGIEDGKIYYTRNNFWTMSEDGSESSEVTVDQGLFVADAETLTETRLASFPEDENTSVSYSIVQNGVIYGLRSALSDDEYGSYSVVRVASDGTELDEVPLDLDAWISLHVVQGDTLFIAQSAVLSSEDDFIQEDAISAVDMTDGSITPLNPNSIDMLFYSESDPCIAISGDRIYYSVYDMERWSVCLKSMNLDGSDIHLLAYGVSSAEG